MVKKCFSNCQKRSKSECSTSRCQYIDGKKHKYCRLKNTYKMDENCVPFLKTQTQRKNNSKRGIPKITTPRSPEITINNNSEDVIKPTQEEMNEFIKRVKKTQASRKIGNLIKKNITKRRAIKKIGKFLRNVNPNKRRAYFLKSVCSDSGVCIAFGKEANTIKKHFKNFSDFNYLSKDAKTIGDVSSNGFVKELTYEHKGYTAYAILKSSSRTNSDNLIYEGFVGDYLNRVGLQYPCFVETYGIYEYISYEAYTYMKSLKLTPKNVFNFGIKEIKPVVPEKLTIACKSPISISILIQHLNDAEALHSKLSDVIFLQNDLMYILFQVYTPLALLRQTFTHYDLHTNNILLYEPVKGYYIEYHYDIKGKLINFKSKYIAKIIDYGRCYFNDTNNDTFSGSSVKIYNEVCSMCKNCGQEKGFDWLDHNPLTLKDDHYICSKIVNRSHDLRTLYIISKLQAYYINKMPLTLRNLLKKVHYDEEFGTPDSKSGFPSKVNNVLDVLMFLLTIRSEENVTNNDKYYENSTKLGDLYIYDDGRTMKYDPVK